MLSVKGLHYERDHGVLFSNLTFDVEPGTFVCVSGSNGSGKSTLLKILTGLLAPTRGQVQWEGRALKPTDPLFLSQIIYLDHKTGLQPTLTPIENLSWLSHASSSDIKMAFSELGLEPFQDFPCEHLSKGQCQRVVLTRLWLQAVPLWILDEPFAALDEIGQRILQQKLALHLKAGGRVVMTSHQPVEIERTKHIRLRYDKNF